MSESNYNSDDISRLVKYQIDSDRELAKLRTQVEDLRKLDVNKLASAVISDGGKWSDIIHIDGNLASNNERDWFAYTATRVYFMIDDDARMRVVSAPRNPS